MEIYRVFTGRLIAFIRRKEICKKKMKRIFNIARKFFSKTVFNSCLRCILELGYFAYEIQINIKSIWRLIQLLLIIHICENRYYFVNVDELLNFCYSLQKNIVWSKNVAVRNVALRISVYVFLNFNNWSQEILREVNPAWNLDGWSYKLYLDSSSWDIAWILGLSFYSIQILFFFCCLFLSLSHSTVYIFISF